MPLNTRAVMACSAGERPEKTEPMSSAGIQNLLLEVMLVYMGVSMHRILICQLYLNKGGKKTQAGQ